MRREDVWAVLEATPRWDLIIVGGGITGAGLFLEATRLGLRVVLFEQRDFAWGTSSRSGKMVHGGLRYLRQGDVRLTWESAREREVLLREAPGLVEPLGFLLPVYSRGERSVLGIGLTLYDLFVRRRHHRYLDADAFTWLAPHVRREGLRGGFCYREAVTDDARLVLRLLADGQRLGGWALNYARVVDLLRDRAGRVVGVAVEDAETGRQVEVRGRVVANATGAWADRLRERVRGTPRLRPLRGVHLIFPAWRFPLAQAIGFFHPVDRRPLYALPWSGATLVGTTDVDHRDDLDTEPAPTPAEVDYLLTALRHTFPHLDLAEGDVVATFAGVRPVIAHGKADPSREPREHAVWFENGLLTVTGGKLTTFRVLAHDALRSVRRVLDVRVPVRRLSLLATAEAAPPEAVEPAAWRRLRGRYGPRAGDLVAEAPEGALQPIEGTPYLWAEIAWALRHDMVVHLDDLLLRRVRVGLLLPDGGLALLPRLKPWCQTWLGWDDNRWEAEVQRYRQTLQRGYRWPRRA